MRFLFALAALFACAGRGVAQQLAVTPDHTNGIYQVGDTVHWTMTCTGTNPAPTARYILKQGGLTHVGTGELRFTNGVAHLQTTFRAPGTMLVVVRAKTPDATERAVAGAVAAPALIGVSAPPPADFEAFWKAKIQELEKVPADPRLQPVKLGLTNVLYWKITLDNIRGTRIEGQLARPARGEKFPALLILQWAGVYGLERNWVTDRAAEGWLALDIEPHDLPIDQPAAFYRRQLDGPLKDYWSIGNDNRDTSYFLRMFLSAYRAVDYLAGRPDWNGQTLVVMGDSQGGWQTLVVAGLHPKNITAALALVPAGCDMLGPEIGRAPGWPRWFLNTAGKHAAGVRDASRYFDTANFAPLIRCPVLVGLGLIDEVCPPAGVLAAANQITAPKQIVILPRSGHQDDHGTQAEYNHLRYDVWLPALRRGKPAPLPR